MYNHVILIGRLGSDPEFKVTNSGDALCKFSIATTGKWLDADKAPNEKTTWHSIVTWKNLAQLCNEHLKKGDIVFIEGEIDNNTWADDSGQKHYTSEVKAKRVLFFDSFKFNSNK